MTTPSFSVKDSLSGIQHPRQQDILCGRGGHSTSWWGNIQFRLLIDDHRSRYMAASKSEREQIAADLVRKWRNQNPAGRFLTRTNPSKGEESLWHDIGDEAASKKVHTSLRQYIPTDDFVNAMRRQDVQDPPIAIDALPGSSATQRKPTSVALPHGRDPQSPPSLLASMQCGQKHSLQWQLGEDSQQDPQENLQLYAGLPLPSQPQSLSSSRTAERHTDQQQEPVFQNDVYSHNDPQSPNRRHGPSGTAQVWNQGDPTVYVPLDRQLLGDVNQDNIQGLDQISEADTASQTMSAPAKEDRRGIGQSIPTAAHLTRYTFGTDDEHDT